MDQNETACAPVFAVKGVGKSDIEGEVKRGSRVEGLSSYRVESLRNLAIALGDFWSEVSGKGGNFVGAKPSEFLGGIFVNPQLKQAVFFKSSQENRRSQVEAQKGEILFQQGADAVGGLLGAV